MNAAIVTGYLNAPAEERWTPGGARKYHFDIVVKADHGHVPYLCVLEDSGLIETAAPLLTAGRPVILQYELGGHPVKERDRVKYWSRYLRVLALEFPNRAGAKKLEPQTAGAEEDEANHE